jgi:hypothetical protein
MIVLILVPDPQKIMPLLPHTMPSSTALHEIACLEVMYHFKIDVLLL